MVEIETQDDFANRLTKLGRKHKMMTKGYTTELRQDGLIIVKPKLRKSRYHGASGLNLILLAVIGFFCIKTLMFVDNGAIVYNERLAKLENGTIVEQFGAKLFQIDPVTQALADFFGPMFR